MRIMLLFKYMRTPGGFPLPLLGKSVKGVARPFTLFEPMLSCKGRRWIIMFGRNIFPPFHSLPFPYYLPSQDRHFTPLSIILKYIPSLPFPYYFPSQDRHFTPLSIILKYIIPMRATIPKRLLALLRLWG